MITTPDKLKLIQQVSGLTQQQMADKIGVSFVAFNNWINGKSHPRKGAIEQIDELYRLYTGQRTIPADLLTAKKAAVFEQRKRYPKILEQTLSRPDVYDQFVLSMTYHSNKIEGSTLSENDTAAILFQNASPPNKSLSEVLEAKNHQTAIKYLFEQLRTKKPIDEALILRLHGILLNGINPDAGFYRTYGVRIIGANLATANYAKVPMRMAELMVDIAPTKDDVIAQAATTHSEFEQIHPFGDGNGRIGRLIMQGMLIRSNLPPAIIRQERKLFYIQYLNKAQTAGDSSLLEDFICDALLEGFKLLE